MPRVPQGSSRARRCSRPRRPQRILTTFRLGRPARLLRCVVHSLRGDPRKLPPGGHRGGEVRAAVAADTVALQPDGAGVAELPAGTAHGRNVRPESLTYFAAAGF